MALGVGVTCGGLSAYSGYKSSTNEQNVALVQGVALFHGLLYSHRYFKTRKLTPAIFAALSAGMLLKTVITSTMSGDSARDSKEL